MAVAFTEFGDGAQLEAQNNFRLTFVNKGGGTGSAVPIQYVPDTNRYAKVKALVNVLEPHCAYKINSIHSLIAVNSEEDIPDDPGGEVPGATWYGTAQVNPDPLRHKVSFHFPGAMFDTEDSAETLGQAIATTLSGDGTTYRFRRWS